MLHGFWVLAIVVTCPDTLTLNDIADCFSTNKNTTAHCIPICCSTAVSATVHFSPIFCSMALSATVHCIKICCSTAVSAIVCCSTTQSTQNWKKQAPQVLQGPPDFPPNLSDFQPFSPSSLNVKIRRTMENFICMPCK